MALLSGGNAVENPSWRVGLNSDAWGLANICRRYRRNCKIPCRNRCRNCCESVGTVGTNCSGFENQLIRQKEHGAYKFTTVPTTVPTGILQVLQQFLPSMDHGTEGTR